jgi:ethanolamine transporter EutH
MGASQPHPEGTSAMNHRHCKVLHAIFSHPVSANIDPKVVEAMFEELGAEVSHNGSGHLAVKLGSHAQTFHNTQHSLSKDEVVAIRNFLTQSGVDPVRDYPL